MVKAGGPSTKISKFFIIDFSVQKFDILMKKAIPQLFVLKNFSNFDLKNRHFRWFLGKAQIYILLEFWS